MLVVLAHDLEDEVVRPRHEHDVVDFGNCGERVGDRLDVALGLHADHRLAPESEAERVGDAHDLHHVALDEALDPAADGGLGEPDHGCDARVRHATVLLEQFDDCLVAVVEHVGRPASHPFPPLTRLPPHPLPNVAHNSENTEM